ncbi:MAG: Anaerobic sulfatase-maturating enzyme [candidate division WS2 bacterium]|nr:Anaerobic sulfatase-maturating enzyme [Candidatus Psychracetigena formicireducens]
MIGLKKIDYSKLAPFRFKKLDKDYLLTNEVGDYVFLTPEDFNKFLEGKLEKKSSQYRALSQKNFIRDKLNFNRLVKNYSQKYRYLLHQGPSLHIIVTTLRCNHRCIYCQASPKNLKQKGFDMDLITAKRTVDFIFSVPNRAISIECQGGEPFLNWPVIEYIFDYALTLNKIAKKNLLLTFVSNYTLLNEARIKFLLKRKVSPCTSLDGPAKVHNFNRRFLNGNSYQTVRQGVKKIQKAYRKMFPFQQKEIQAVMTTSKYSLKYPREIVDEYLKLGLKAIFIRPMNSFCLRKETWQKFGYLASEYAYFYKTALDYIINLNLKGRKIKERTAEIFLRKILTKNDPNFLDLRSPCGAGIGQLAYNYNGDIYTCDEGRMLAEKGDLSFKLGNVSEIEYPQLINHPVIRILTLASCLDALPHCSHCVWKPYCGICPLYNYAQYGNIFSQAMNNNYCQINNQIFQIIFERLKNKKIKSIFLNWLK